MESFLETILAFVSGIYGYAIKLPRKKALDAVRNVALPSILLQSGAEKVKLKSLNKCGTACSTQYRVGHQVCASIQ